MYNYQMTNYPTIFKNVYWGNFEYNISMYSNICINRNRFINEYDIKQFNDYNFEELSQEINKFISLAINSKDREFFDHYELYKNNNNEYILIVSPYNHLKNPKQYIYKYNFDIIYPLYADNAYTFIKIIKNKNDVNFYYSQ